MKESHTIPLNRLRTMAVVRKHNCKIMLDLFLQIAIILSVNGYLGFHLSHVLYKHVFGTNVYPSLMIRLLNKALDNILDIFFAFTIIHNSWIRMDFMNSAV